MKLGGKTFFFITPFIFSKNFNKNVEQSLLHYLENIIKQATRQTVLSLELNFFNKKVSVNSTKMHVSL
jgi:hypothetical protein